jgi:hypothetical protein
LADKPRTSDCSHRRELRCHQGLRTLHASLIRPARGSIGTCGRGTTWDDDFTGDARRVNLLEDLRHTDCRGIFPRGVSSGA